MALTLEGKVAVITGAASGIGLATVELFVAQGARVIAADRQVDQGQALADRFAGQVRFEPCDVTHCDDLKRAIAEAALFRGSDAAGFTTGTHLTVDGGITIGARHAWDPDVACPFSDALGISPAELRARRAARQG